MIEIECSDCGRLVVGPALVEVHANQRDGFILYAALCPGCGELVVGGDRRVVQQAIDAGARQLELLSVDLPPLTLDDLLDLHARLEADEGTDASGGRPLEADPL